MPTNGSRLEDVDASGENFPLARSVLRPASSPGMAYYLTNYRPNTVPVGNYPVRFSATQSDTLRGL